MGRNAIHAATSRTRPVDVTPTAGFHPSADIRPGPDRQASGADTERQRRISAMRTSKALLLVPLLSLVVPALTGCGLAGGSWDVTMEVTGGGSATVTTKFAGEPDAGTTTSTPLPFNASRNVGFGWNRIDVRGGAPGTACRTLVDGVVREEHQVDAGGAATCRANNQNP
jgi:hypothetical protein